ncbi:c-type cytochrome [Metallibacterium scheffleri]
MNAKQQTTIAMHLIAGVLLFGLCSPAAWAKAPDPLQAAVQRGAHLFATDTFGGHGMTCQSCHSGGGKIAGQVAGGGKIPSLANAAAIFPRYSPRAGKVITLEDQIRGCIAGGLGGKPPAYGSQALTDLASYLTFLSNGKPIDMGGKPG